ncbi:hypothetical protein D4Q85_00250 [bacterium]|nr:MAG: hypothetical protein D4Q85_00250 [bacterium]
METLTNIKAAVAGWKTYIVAGAAIITALVAWSGDTITLQQLIEAIFAAVAAMTIRAGVAKSGPK